ncbi:amphi-Trp domain-containing protein [Natrialba sp. SSL1]|uniref:amphi-Trp domain-containing protein n=1 Tax=Natrialba sp. SSL1 TaxID=1869245 RepID=UPI0008F8273F|nr:amphi-Trp domain-containing protein [Natrialba sp. SSL1]OIB57057.1 amphi-Trp domain-containing protein [Natrialba sp. SSL1]
MGETTTYDDDVSRSEAADLLEAIAAELDGPDTADIRVGNKLLTLSPDDRLEYGIEVEERSPMLGGEREEVTITLGWEVATADAGADIEQERDQRPDEEREEQDDGVL